MTVTMDDGGVYVCVCSCMHGAIGEKKQVGRGTAVEDKVHTDRHTHTHVREHTHTKTDMSILIHDIETLGTPNFLSSFVFVA